MADEIRTVSEWKHTPSRFHLEGREVEWQQLPERIRKESWPLYQVVTVTTDAAGRKTSRTEHLTRVQLAAKKG